MKCSCGYTNTPDHIRRCNNCGKKLIFGELPDCKNRIIEEITSIIGLSKENLSVFEFDDKGIKVYEVHIQAHLHLNLKSLSRLIEKFNNGSLEYRVGDNCYIMRFYNE